MTDIKMSCDKVFTNSPGKRLQIRGFPTIWTEKLTFDDIGWLLFDLLVNYGSIDNINISLSKNSVLYGIVDMMGAKDAQAVFDNLLDEKGHYRLDEWNATLQFKLLGGPPMVPKIVQKDDDPFRISVRDELLPLKKNVATRDNDDTPRTYGRDELLALKRNAPRYDDTPRTYGRDELLALKGNATRNFKVDDAFATITRAKNFQPSRDERKPWRPGPLKACFEKSGGGDWKT